MAKVTSPSGTGNLADTMVISVDGKARVWVQPRDPQTDEQRRYRQLMRGLYVVLPCFSAPIDEDLKALAGIANYWSAYTFQQWAANHGTAIQDDLPYYGASNR